MYIVANAILALSALIYSLWIPLASCRGVPIPPLQSLFSYSQLRENKARKQRIPRVPFWTSSSSIVKRRLYLVTRSPRERPPNLMNRTPSPTALRGGKTT